MQFVVNSRRRSGGSPRRSRRRSRDKVSQSKPHVDDIKLPEPKG